jgi:hypothetical protein
MAIDSMCKSIANSRTLQLHAQVDLTRFYDLKAWVTSANAKVA